MDLKKAKLLLDKINALYQSINTDKKNVSSIERDLMRSYILQFYESFMDIPQLHEEEKPSAIEIIKSASNSEPIKAAAPAPKPVVIKEPTPVPPIPIPLPKKEEKPVEEKPIEEKQMPAVEVVAKEEKPAPAPTPAPAPRQPALEISDDMEELFSFNNATELSEKLSEMPIADIKKSMGLNERIFTVNELFGGDQAVFDLTLDTLNKLADFNQAKSFLVRNAATKYEWTAKGRKSKAKNFIKLVKRRYN